MAEHPFQPLNPSLRIPPAHARSHSRSSSRSPERRSWFFTHELDPLLNNLSPHSTLQALSSIDSVPTDEKTAQDLLAKSIAEVSTTERALGIRAAVAAQKLREWHQEITSWGWPTGEDVRLGKGFIPPMKKADNTVRKLGAAPSGTRDDFVDDYLGSLPVSLVDLHAARIDEIKDGMDALDVDELKEHVLNAHIPSRSRPSSSNSALCTAPQRLSYVQLSDFTAVVTATILQALPWLSRLNALLTTWDVRIVVLWQIPGLLESLKTTRAAINAALASLASQAPPSEDDALYSQSSFRATRQNLEYLVVSAGSKIDRILDSLEGREDSLPEAWIDDMESIEADFGNWVVEAEKLAIRNEWSRVNIQPNDIQTTREDEAEVTSLRGQSEVKSLTTHQSTNSTSSSYPTTPVKEQGSPTTQNVAEPEVPNPPSPINYVDNPQTLASKPSSLGSEQRSSKLPNDIREAERTSQIEPYVNDGESIQSTDSNPGSDDLAKPFGISHPPITEGRPIVESSAQSRVKDADVNSAHVSSLSPGVKTAQAEPEMRSAALDSPSLTEVGSESESSEVRSTDDSITGSDSQFPQPSNLDHSSVIIREDIRSNSSSDMDQQDDKRVGDEGPQVEFATDSSHTFKHNLEHVPSSSEVAHNEVVDRTASLTSPPVGSYTLPSPEINVTSPAQSDEEISPRNTSFGGRRDSSVSPTDAVASTAGAAPFQFKHESQKPSKKLKHKPGPLDLAAITAKSHRRSVSGDSLASDCMSGASSPEIQDALTATSHGSPMVVEATSPRTQSKYPRAKPSRTHSAQTVQGPSLYRRTTEPPSPAESLELNRTASLPLQRFIDDYHGQGPDGSYKAIRPAEIKRASVTSIEVRPKTELKSIVVARKGSSSSVSDVKTAPTLRHSTSNLSQYSDTKGDGIIEEEENSRSLCPSNSAENLSVRRDSPVEEQSPLLRVLDRRQRITQAPASPVSPTSPIIPRRSSKRLSKRPDSRSSGSFGHRNNKQDSTSPALASPLTPVNSNMKPAHVKSSEERLEDKINSILTTIPAKIKLGAAPNQNIAAPSSLESSGKGDSFGSASPRSTPTRSSTPTPSLTLTPAFARSKRPHVHSNDEPSVRLYHLHRGEKSAPVKLFVRPVGENGERVMVRVGGGWADLGEYLREYTVHHGRRTVSDGRFDVQSLPTNSSPAYSSGASTITPTTNNGRSTPISRPGSALSARPSSSLAVRKTRKSTISSAETPSLTSANVQRISEDSPPLPSIPKRHRLSMSSTTSAGLTSAAGDSPYSSAAQNTTMHSTPLGLSGPKPKARHASMTPESEAWVEGVIGQARKTSSSLKPKRSIPGFRTSRLMSGKDDTSNNDKSLNEAKTRSVSDFGTLGLNRRVFLRGLGKEKGKGKD